MASENGWTRVPLSDCAMFQEGYVNPSQKVATYFGDEIKWLRAVDLQDSYVRDTSRKISIEGYESAGKSALLFEPDTLAISKSGTIGRLGILKDFMCGNRAVINIRVVADKSDLYFLFYALQYHRREICELATGSVQRNLYTSVLGDFHIQLPPLAEQKAMASILISLDDKIELNRRMNETLEAMARALFKSWFVDFDPVRAKLDGRQPAGMDADTAALFPDGFEHTELGLVPKGWKSEPLCHIANIIMGTSPPSATYNEDGIGSPLINGPVEFGSHFPVKRKWTTAPTRFSKPKDLIFCVRGSTTGRRIVSDGEYCLGRGVCAIRAKWQQQAYINRVIEVELGRLLSSATGSVFPSLSGPQMNGFHVIVAAEPVLTQFCSIVRPLDNKIESNILQSQKLEKLRDALLPKLLSGELRVGEALHVAERVT